MKTSLNYTGVTITQPCHALYIQLKDWSLPSIVLLIWKAWKSCKQNKRYDSTSEHMVLNRHTQNLSFSLSKPCGQLKTSEYLSTPLYGARKELHLLSTLWKQTEAQKPDSSSNLSHSLPITQCYGQDSFWSEAVADWGQPFQIGDGVVVHLPLPSFKSCFLVVHVLGLQIPLNLFDN